MKTNNRRTAARFPLAALLAVVASFALSAVTHAESSTPPPGAPIVTPGQPPADPATPTAPAPATPPAEPAAPARREDEPTAPAPAEPAPAGGGNNPPPAPGAKAPTVFARAVSFLQGREGIAASISERDRTISDLRAQLADRDKTIAAQLAELNELRAGSKDLEGALAKLEGDKKTVAQTVAGLGFPANNLPGQTPIEGAPDSVEGLLAQFQAEKDPVKKGEIHGRISARRAELANAGRN